LSSIHFVILYLDRSPYPVLSVMVSQLFAISLGYHFEIIANYRAERFSAKTVAPPLIKQVSALFDTHNCITVPTAATHPLVHVLSHISPVYTH